jgi:lactoylglutathione lyase
VKTLHTAYRVTDLAVSLDFYSALGYQEVGRISLGDGATLTVLKFPGEDVVTLELVHRRADERVRIGTGFSHLVIQVDELAGTIAALSQRGLQPEPAQPPASRAPGSPAGTVARTRKSQRALLVEFGQKRKPATRRGHRHYEPRGHRRRARNRRNACAPDGNRAISKGEAPPPLLRSDQGGRGGPGPHAPGLATAALLHGRERDALRRTGPVAAPFRRKQRPGAAVERGDSSRPRRAAHAASPSSFSYTIQPSAGAILARR